MSDKTRVLIIEDLPTDAMLAEREVSRVLPECVFMRVETKDEFLSALASFKPDMILSDFKLPQFDGLTALKLAQSHAPEVPFIIFTGSMNEDTAVDCMKSGAWDYVIKEHIKRLGPAVMNGLEQRKLLVDRNREKAERERLTAAIEQVGEVIFITDPQGTIQYVNPAFEIITGYSRAEAIGNTPRMLKSGEHHEAFYRELWETISNGQTWKGRMVNRRKDGTLYIDESIISPVFSSSGQIVNYIAVKRDITEQIRTSEEKAELEEQLRQIQKVEAIGRLAGGVAHDFNNMLSVILGYGECLLARLPPQDPLRADVHEIMNAGQRSAALTRQLLAFSRKQTLQPKVLDLNTLIQNLNKMLHRLIGEDIALELPLAKDLALVMADPGQIEQVIMNLAVNARDAMPHGGKLTIETANVVLDESYAREHVSVQPGKYVMLAVTDTGCGMDKDILSKLFEPFFTTKERGKGTGLGLATVYGIVKQSGGNIWVYSEPGRGSTFKIYLPQTQVEPETSATRDKKENRKGHGEQILVVEDDDALRKLCWRMLASLGYQVTPTANGAEALHLIEEKEFKPQLIVTDVIMPEMGGAVLVDRIRRTHPDIKVLFMSGYTDDALLNQNVLNSGVPFIHKPFTAPDLAEKVWNVLHETDRAC